MQDLGLRGPGAGLSICTGAHSLILVILTRLTCMLCPAILQRGKLRPKEAEWIYCSPAANGGDLKTGQGAEAADGPGCTSSPGPAGVHCIPKARIFGQHFPAWVALGAHSCLQQVSLLSSPPVHSQGQSLLSVDPPQPALGTRFRVQCPAQSVGGCWSQPGDRGVVTD